MSIILEKLFSDYLTEQGHSDSDNTSSKKNLMWKFIEALELDNMQEMEFDELLGDLVGSYEEQGFIAGFRKATSIWKEC